MISAKDVNELRSQTGAGMMDCKKALTECNGDMQAAIDWLREKGIAKAAKKADRIAAEGLANIFTEGNKAVILEVNCETDFVTKNSEFVEMIENIGKAILNSNAQNLDEIMELDVEGQTVNEYIIAQQRIRRQLPAGVGGRSGGAVLVHRGGCGPGHPGGGRLLRGTSPGDRGRLRGRLAARRLQLV